MVQSSKPCLKGFFGERVFHFHENPLLLGTYREQQDLRMGLWVPTKAMLSSSGSEAPLLHPTPSMRVLIFTAEL